jgi:hypothetical protein
MSDISKRDPNRITSLLAVSNINPTSTVTLYADPSTHELLIQGTLTVTGGATATNQTDGSQKTQIVDGSGNVIGATSNALDVNIKSGASAGEQYTDNTLVNAAYKGTIIAGTDGSNYQFLSVSSVGVLNIAGAVTATNSTASNLKVEATLAATQTLATLTTITNDVGIKDNGNSITVDNAGTFAVQATLVAETTKVIGTINVAASQTIAVTNAGTFATQATLQTQTNTVMVGGINVKEINGTTPLMGNGASGTGALRVSIANDSTGIVALTTSTASIGKLAVNSGVDIGDVDVTSISAGTNLIGDVDVAPRTTGGWSVGNYTSGDTYTALTNGAQVIKASAGKFGGYYIYNPNTAATYVFIYNIAAASVTVGTSTAKLVFCIPASSGANLEILAGIPFDTAMAIAAATTGGGNGAPTTALEAMVWYK